MKKLIALLFTLHVLMAYSSAQSYIEPIIGYQLDLKKDNKFKQFNAGLQYSIALGKSHELFLMCLNSFSTPYHGTDSSFAINPSLPLVQIVKKDIRVKALAFAVGQRFTLKTIGTNNTFFFLLLTGLKIETASVTYTYNKNDYTILNPDVTRKRTGFYMGFGLEYVRTLPFGRMFANIHIDTPPFGKGNVYPSSFSFMTPLSMNIGYSIKLKKTSYEKK